MPEIDHVIVLMLENRSLDHMLVFLDRAELREARTEVEATP